MGRFAVFLEKSHHSQLAHWIRNTHFDLDIFSISSRRESHYSCSLNDTTNSILLIDPGIFRQRGLYDSSYLPSAVFSSSERCERNCIGLQHDTNYYMRDCVKHCSWSLAHEGWILHPIYDCWNGLPCRWFGIAFNSWNRHKRWSMDWVSNRSRGWCGSESPGIDSQSITSERQMPILAVHTVVPLHDIAVANALFLLFQQLGPAIFVAIAQTVLLNKFLPQLQALSPDLTKMEIVEAGATGLKALVTESELPTLLVAYAKSVDAVFIIAATLASVAAILALCVEWKSIKKDKPTAVEDS